MRNSVFQLIDDENLVYLKGIIVDGKKATKDTKFKKNYTWKLWNFQITNPGVMRHQ